MQERTAEDIAWAAGLFEGEGSLWTAGRTGIRASVSMTDRDVVERFCAIVGSGRVRPLPPRQPHHTPQYRWEIARVEQVRELIALFRPWLGDRRRLRADELLAHARENHGSGDLRTHCPAGHPYDEANTYVDKKGRRSCRACTRAAQQAWERRKRLERVGLP
jgi:hypothetical protein